MYAKVFTQIFDSSIADDYQVRHVFEDLLKLADVEGVVDMTAAAIARRTNVPIEMVLRAIGKLVLPDPSSRTRVEAGRRLKLIDERREWGWLIINYELYRNLQNEASRRETWKESKREQRAKAKEEAALKPGQPLPGEDGYVDAALAGASQEELDKLVDERSVDSALRFQAEESASNRDELKAACDTLAESSQLPDERKEDDEGS